MWQFKYAFFAEIKSLQSNLTLEEIQDKDAKLKKEVNHNIELC